jgi:hypothetical protein
MRTEAHANETLRKRPTQGSRSLFEHALIYDDFAAPFGAHSLCPVLLSFFHGHLFGSRCPRMRNSDYSPVSHSRSCIRPKDVSERIVMLSRRDGASGRRRATSGTGRSLAGFSGGRRIGDDLFFGALPMLRGCARNGPHRSLRHVASALAPCGWRAPFCWLAARGNPEQRDDTQLSHGSLTELSISSTRS